MPHFTTTASELLPKAKKASRIIENCIIARREKLIQKQMTGWFRSKTREKAIEALQSYNFSEYSLIPLNYYTWSEVCDRLIATCQIAIELGTDEVKVSSKDAQILRDILMKG